MTTEFEVPNCLHKKILTYVSLYLRISRTRTHVSRGLTVYSHMFTTTETKVVDANELYILQCATMFFSIIRLWEKLYEGSLIWAT
jgi:hypothetical protein